MGGIDKISDGVPVATFDIYMEVYTSIATQHVSRLSDRVNYYRFWFQA